MFTKSAVMVSTVALMSESSPNRDRKFLWALSRNDSSLLREQFECSFGDVLFLKARNQQIQNSPGRVRPLASLILPNILI